MYDLSVTLIKLVIKLALMTDIIPHVVVINGYGWIVKYLWRYLRLYENRKNKCLFMLRILTAFKILRSQIYLKSS